jgi:hypothetical protein
VFCTDCSEYEKERAAAGGGASFGGTGAGVGGGGGPCALVLPAVLPAVVTVVVLVVSVGNLRSPQPSSRLRSLPTPPSGVLAS